jgi:two-component system, chemotaxis family, chemotaxis protein CheY
MSYNILVVDDSQTVRAVISKTLSIAGVPINELHEAANGEEGLAVLKEKWVDLVFTDINMPVMNGVEMIERMQQEDMLQSIPVVVVSTEGSKTRIEDLIQKGVRAYIRKPFTPEILRDIVDKLLGGQHE